MRYLISLLLICISLSSSQPHTEAATITGSPHLPITEPLYSRLVKYAHLIDIAYCISGVTRIQPPFECENGCDAFNDTEVLFQWSSDDLDMWRRPWDALRPQFRIVNDRFATTGYIAAWHPRETIVIVLRGTRSFKDTIVDLNTDMVEFGPDCPACKVHSGFLHSFRKTWLHIQQTVQQALVMYPAYKVVVMGHSMGGAVSVLLGVELLKFKHDIDDLEVITMGQPMVGNKIFAHYVDSLLHLRGPGAFEEGKLLRVTHKNDPIVKLPLSDSYIIGERYAHSSNEIFIDELGHHLPDIGNVVYCEGSEDDYCSHGMKFTRDNTEHLNYFRRMGMCGIGPF